MAKKSSKAASGSGTVNTIVLIGGIIVIVGVILLVINQREILKKDKDIKNLGDKIVRQETLHPPYQLLAKKNEKLEKRILDELAVLPATRRGTLPASEVGELSDIFKSLALKTNMGLENITLDVTEMKKGMTALQANLELNGNLDNFRTFLIELINMPYVRNLEEIKIETGAVIKKFKLSLWLALE